MLDAAPQLAIVWARANRDMTALPSAVAAFHRYAQPSGSEVRCELRLRTANESFARFDALFLEPDGRIVAALEGLEATCSRALNRLAIGAAVG
jgi:hypothetical protein